MTSTSYEIGFSEPALKAWRKLDNTIKIQFKKKLEKLKDDPRAAPLLAGPLHGLYKIKLRDSGYRLVYAVKDSEVMILVVNVGRRNHDQVYDDIGEGDF
ncbi:type II toxin-antitoxin system RelE family toxin [Novacetimonas hansenii]|uniref:RelE toxin n=1 Tax=Novacetimonas hansenii TaxID=436 RepID=A0ABQ0SH58_NOVHA|nr:type II toxin-antitoxin system RelE/ParE family toxin [Novacetimonas hansenii]GAN84029.1 translation repressor RelE/RelB/StbE [Novacetimonas hansenii JCM 7643]GBQ55813.1 translation repressor RelE/RelB/StbE [Novacetimonas hansenii NRIC 0243]GEC64609.1 RelE toxin [Novacetimonas hansenii]